MIRTQIQLPNDLATKVKESAARQRVSMAEVIRRAVVQSLTAAPETGVDRYARAVAAAGQFASGRGDLSARHDAHFAEAARP